MNADENRKPKKQPGFVRMKLLNPAFGPLAGFYLRLSAFIGG